MCLVGRCLGHVRKTLGIGFCRALLWQKASERGEKKLEKERCTCGPTKRIRVPDPEEWAASSFSCLYRYLGPVTIRAYLVPTSTVHGHSLSNQQPVVAMSNNAEPGPSSPTTTVSNPPPSPLRSPKLLADILATQDHNRSISFDMDVESGNGTAVAHKNSFDNIDRDRFQEILENRKRGRIRDPFGLGSGIKNSDQLKEISRQKHGRRLVKHYKAQNDVRRRRCPRKYSFTML